MTKTKTAPAAKDFSKAARTALARKGITMKNQKSPAARAGALWGDVDGLNGKLCGARERFMQQRPQLTEVEWPAFRDAYNTAIAATSRN